MIALICVKAVFWRWWILFPIGERKITSVHPNPKGESDKNSKFSWIDFCGFDTGRWVSSVALVSLQDNGQTVDLSKNMGMTLDKHPDTKMAPMSIKIDTAKVPHGRGTFKVVNNSKSLILARTASWRLIWSPALISYIAISPATTMLACGRRSRFNN